MDERGQDVQVNEKLQLFLEVNEQVEDIVKKDLVIPYGKSSGRIGEVVSGILLLVIRIGIIVPIDFNDEIFFTQGCRKSYVCA